MQNTLLLDFTNKTFVLIVMPKNCEVIWLKFDAFIL